MKKTTKAATILAGVTAAALGAYFYSKTPKGKKKMTELKTKAKAWVTHAKKDILKKVKDLKKVNKATYNKIVDVVMEKYETAKKIAPKEVVVVGKEIKKHWDMAKKDIGNKVKEDIKKEI